jgi:hypothetical protein
MPGRTNGPTATSGRHRAADWSRAMTLTGAEFLAAWYVLGLGESPVELRLRPPGNTIADRDRTFDAELVRLRERGLAAMQDAGIRPRARLTSALRLLADAPLAYDLRLSTGLIALGAVDGENGVVLGSSGVPAQRPGVAHQVGELRLVEARGPLVPAALVDVIGPIRTGRSRTVNIDGGTLDQAHAMVDDGSVWTLADKLVELGAPRVDANALARMCTGVTGWGQIGALARGAGVERRGRWVVGFHRAEGGDFLQLRRPTVSGRPHVTIAPITADGLLAHVGALVADLPIPARL